MSTSAETILDAALKLSEEDRQAIVARLLESLPNDHDGPDLDDPEFLDEMDRRFSDPTGSVEWSKLRDED